MESRMNLSKLGKLGINSILYVCYLCLLFPNIIVQGIINKEIMLGDPFYTSRIKSASNNLLEINGNYLPTGSIFNGKTDLLSFGEMLIGGVGRLLQISVSDMYIYSSLIIGVSILVLMKRIFKLVNWNNNFAILFCVLGIYLFWGPFLPYGLERPISPQIVLLIWSGYILLFLQNMIQPTISKSIWIGAVAGLSLYIHYPFLFLQIVAGLFILLIVNIVQKKQIHMFLIPIIIACLLAIPNLIWNFNLSKHTEYQDLMFRAAMVNSHLPAAGKTGIIGVVILVLTFTTRRIRYLNDIQRNGIIHNFIVTQTIACVGIANSNLITGKSIEFSNHFEIFIYTLFIITLGIFFYELGVASTKYSTKLGSKKLAFFGSFVLILVLIFESGMSLSRVQKQPQPTLKNQEIWGWVEKNLKDNVGILFEGQAEAAAVILKQELFFSRDMFNFNFSQSEINMRYFANYGCKKEEFSNQTFSAISGVRKEALVHKIDRYLRVSNALHLGTKVSNYFLHQKSLEINSINSLKFGALKDFTNVEKLSCIEFVKSRGVDYIFSLPNGNWNRFSLDPRLKLIAVVQNTNVYRVF